MKERIKLNKFPTDLVSLEIKLKERIKLNKFPADLVSVEIKLKTAKSASKEIMKRRYYYHIIGLTLMILGGLMGSIFIILIPLGLGLILSDIIGKPLGNICFNLLGGSNSNNYKHKPQPLYSKIKSKEAKGDYQEAFTEYRKAFEKFPHDKELFLGIIKLSIQNLNNKMMAEKYYKQGLKKISKKELKSFCHVANGYLSLIGNDNWQNDETSRVKTINIDNYDSNSSEKQSVYDSYDDDNIEDIWDENEVWREKNEWENKASNKVKNIKLKNHNNDESSEMDILEKALAERRQKNNKQ